MRDRTQVGDAFCMSSAQLVMMHPVEMKQWKFYIAQKVAGKTTIVHSKQQINK